MAIANTDEKSYQENDKRLIDEIEKKHGKSIEQLRQEREKRVLDATMLKEPDRVPVTIHAGDFAARYYGVPLSAMYYDPVAYNEACLKVLLEFEPDSGMVGAGTSSGLMLELLDPRHQRWPGGNLPPHISYQFVEGEYMTADEYDLFLTDPSDFIIRYLLPRLYGIFEPLSDLPPIEDIIGGLRFSAIIAMLNKPQFKELGQKLAKAAEEQEKWMKASASFAARAARFGYSAPPPRGSTPGGAPFDAVSDFLRGMRGAMIDMYRCPDKLLAACDLILDWRIARSTPAKPKYEGEMIRGGGAPLHRGSDGFMSIEQFEKFYWPGLKKAIMTAIDMGYTTSSFCEGVWDQRLEYWLEIPKGKASLSFERTSIFRAKEVLGGHQCIRGGVPATLLEAGSPSEVEEWCKKLIEVCGKGGGFIMGPGSSMERAKPENVKAMVDSAKKYGRY